MNALDVSQETKEKIVKEANGAFEFNMQVFEELDKIGALLPEEAQDGGLPVHDGKGDMCKCPYYASKLAGSKDAACPCHLALAALKQPTIQLVLAACVAVTAGIAAWYVM
uniref:Uncharacterized protein n=2 Tax=Micrurus lemniscatus lemniscatus TaxID=129467 RepID=A0A2D4IQD8_MICLE